MIQSSSSINSIAQSIFLPSGGVCDPIIAHGQLLKPTQHRSPPRLQQSSGWQLGHAQPRLPAVLALRYPGPMGDDILRLRFLTNVHNCSKAFLLRMCLTLLGLLAGR